MFCAICSHLLRAIETKAREYNLVDKVNSWFDTHHLKVQLGKEENIYVKVVLIIL